MNNEFFGKNMGNGRKYSVIKLVTTESSMITKLLYYKVFQRKFISNRNEKKNKTEILIYKSVYLGLSILKLSKILMFEFWYDYVKPKYSENLNCAMWIQAVPLYT